jgi:predicted lipoprotein with Yx(FWY)xxD motif
MIRPALTALCAAALAAGCGDDKPSGSGAGASSGKARQPKAAVKVDRAPTPRKGRTVEVVDSQFGRILADRRGQAFYSFGKEKSRTSECYGACAKAWPPVLTKGKPRADTARRRLLGTTRRRDGKLQVTYRGRPLYYYERDSPGRVLCNDVNEFGGLWLVVRPDRS